MCAASAGEHYGQPERTHNKNRKPRTKPPGQQVLPKKAMGRKRNNAAAKLPPRILFGPISHDPH